MTYTSVDANNCSVFVEDNLLRSLVGVCELNSKSGGLGVGDFGSFDWIVGVHVPLCRVFQLLSQQMAADSTEERVLTAELVVQAAVCDVPQDVLEKLVFMLMQSDYVNILFDKNDTTLAKALGDKLPSIQLHCLKNHESVTLGTIDCLLRREAESFGLSDTVVDVFDYCYRKVLDIFASPAQLTSGTQDSKKSNTSLNHSERSLLPLLQLASTGISILRSLLDAREKLHIGLTRRVFMERDLLMLLVAVIESSPWVDRGKDQLKKFSSGRWMVWSDENELCDMEGSVWILVYMLVFSGEVSNGSYDLSMSYRTTKLLNLRKYLSDRIVCQIPVLAQLVRFLEELNMRFVIGEQLRSSNSLPGCSRENYAIGVFAIAEVKQSLRDTVEGYFNNYSIPPISDFSQLQTIAKSLALIYEEHCDELNKENRLIDSVKPKKVPSSFNCAVCNQENVENQCSNCKRVYYCSRDCQIDHWPAHKEFCRTK